MIIIIPALNEEKTIGPLVNKLSSLFPEALILVVDDASSDRTAQVAREAGAQVLPLPFRLGYWGALQAGFLYGFYSGYDWFVTFDADGQHLPEEVSKLLDPLKSGQADVVIGSYMERGDFFKKIAWAFFRRLTGLKIKDLTSGFRAYHRQAVKILIDIDFLVLDNADLASLIILHQAALRLVEVPVLMNMRISGKSKIFASHFKILRYLFGSLVLSLSKRKFI